MADTMQSSRKDPSIRKNNKPLMEKRRRARINSCLSELKTLVLHAMKKDSSQFSKLEKADILELTLKHLRALQRQQLHATSTPDPSVMTKYRAGFNECANEVMRYMGAGGVSDDIRSRLVGHLANCMQSVNSIPQQENNIPHRCMQPLQVKIPSTTPYQKPHPVSISSYSNSTSPSVTSPGLTPRIISPDNQSQRLSGSFQVVPGNVNCVSVYVDNGGSMPVYSLQVPSVNNGVSAFVPSPSNVDLSPVKYETSYLEESKKQCNMSFSCSPSSNGSLKEERVWRPW